MSTYTERNNVANPKQGIRTCGDLEFADATNHKYPINPAAHVRAARSYINHKDNAAEYDRDEVKVIKSRMKRAAKKHGVEIEADQVFSFQS